MSKQAKILRMARSTAYYKPVPVSESDLALMAVMDRIHLERPYAGKGCWRDNVVIERFWRTVKYEEVYLRAYETTSEARKRLHEYIAFYNTGRGHQALDYKTPDEAYFVNQVAAFAA